MLARPLCRNASGIVVEKNLGGFCRGFSWRNFIWAFLPHKNEQKQSKRQNPRENPVAQKQKIPRESVLPKSDPKTWGLATSRGGFPQFTSITRYGAQHLRGYELRARWSSDEAAEFGSEFQAAFKGHWDKDDDHDLACFKKQLAYPVSPYPLSLGGEYSAPKSKERPPKGV